MIRLALQNPAGVGDWRARLRAPDILVDATFHAIADVGSIPTVSTFREPPTGRLSSFWDGTALLAAI